VQREPADDIVEFARWAGRIRHVMANEKSVSVAVFLFVRAYADGAGVAAN